MNVIDQAITALASEGRLTLQIPELAIGPYSVSEASNDWFVRASYGCPTVGRERGFLFLSRKGWAINKPKIKAAFESSKDQRGTWDEFEQFATDFHKSLDAARNKKIAALRKKISDLEQVVI